MIELWLNWTSLHGYIEQDIMRYVELHDDAKEDLKSIRCIDSVNAARLVALLQELNTDEDLRDRLLDRNSDEDDRIHIMRWVEQFNKGKNLYRIKVWDEQIERYMPYRVIYAYLPHDPIFNYVVLAIVHRKDFNYESTNNYTHRILRAYDDLNIW